MQIKKTIQKFDNHLKNHLSLYLLFQAVFMGIAFFGYKKGFVLQATLPIQSAFGVGFATINLGVVLAIIGAVLLLIAGKSFKTMKSATLFTGKGLLGAVLLGGGILMAGSSVTASIFNFFDKIGPIGTTALLVIILFLVIKR
jgi:hypothetical protein